MIGYLDSNLRIYSSFGGLKILSSGESGSEYELSSVTESLVAGEYLCFPFSALPGNWFLFTDELAPPGIGFAEVVLLYQ